MIGVVLAIAVASAGCGGGEPRYPYPERVVEQFVAGCLVTGGSRSYCECTAREMQEQVPLSDFMALERSVLLSGNNQAILNDPRIQDAIEACVGEY